MISHTSLRVAAGTDGVTRAVNLHAEAPQLVRVTQQGTPDSPLMAHLCGGAAGPLGGDRATFDVAVDRSSRLAVRSVAATLVQPGPRSAPSHGCVHATVAAEGELDWWPEPLIAVAECDHRLECRIDVIRGARLRWVDEIVSGRWGEPGGRIAVHQRVHVDGRVVSDQELTTKAKVVVSAIEIGGPSPPDIPSPIVEADVRAAVMWPEPGVAIWAAVGRSVDVVRAALAELGLIQVRGA